MMRGVARQLAITAACASAGCSLLVSDGGPPEDGVPTCPTAFSMSGEGACLINASGELYCWGHTLVNATGSGVDQTLPTRIDDLDDVRDVHVGEFHACAVHGDDGQVSCWGRNDAGQVGDGTLGTIRATPTAVVGISGAVMVRTGQYHTCAVYGSERRVRCWGDNASGELGDGFAGRLDASGDDVPSLTGVLDLAVGDAFTCAITADRIAVCWGSNERGSLGDGTTDLDRSTPLPVASLPEVDELSAGCHLHVCAIDGADMVWCWGDNRYGQTGSGADGYWDMPQQLINLPAQSVAVGGLHTCAAHNSGDVYCWGDNQKFELGFVTPGGVAQTAPGKVQGLPLNAATVDVEAGCAQSCARRTDGSIWCWGSNTHGELGDGTTETRIDPRPIEYECQ